MIRVLIHVLNRPEVAATKRHRMRRLSLTVLLAARANVPSRDDVPANSASQHLSCATPITGMVSVSL
jgi:hypothetical protein